MRHLLKEIALGMGFNVTTLCGAQPTSSYDYIQVYFTDSYGICAACQRLWYEAKKNENEAFERERQAELNRNAHEAGKRLDGSHT